MFAIAAVAAIAAGIGSFFAGPKVVTGPDGQTVITDPNGMKAAFNQPNLPAQPLQAGKRKPTTQEIATAMSFVVVAPGGQPTPKQLANQQAFENSIPGVDWNSPTNAEVDAGIEFMMSDAFTPPPGAGIPG